MGVLDKLMFWKKDDFSSFDMKNFKSSANDPLGSTPLHENLGLESDSYGQDSLAAKAYNQQNTPSQDNLAPAPPNEFQNPYGKDAPSSLAKQKEMSQKQSSNKDLELISSKLDTIKAYLQSLDARVASIERIAKQEEQEMQKQQGHNLW